MRATLVGLVWIAACYTPEIAPGAPCAPNGLCPEGQSCIDRFCVIPGLIDASIDAAPDMDGDGKPDMMDNCPDIANPEQENEDGDKFGNACDPCPGFADDTPTDSDGDGVADLCDPNPAMPGDKIELFEPFDHGLPSWMRTGDWTASSGAVRIDAPAETALYMVVPASTTDHIQVFASVVIESVATAMLHYIEVSLPNDTAGNLGIGCEAVQTAIDPTNARYLSLWDGLNPTTNMPPFPPGRELASQSEFRWDVGKTYVLSLQRLGSIYTCRVISNDGAVTLDARGTSGNGASVASPTVVVRARSLAVHVNWVMVVHSP